MKKRRIVIASVLKPVDDTRMFEKMGKTLSDSAEYEIFIIGYPSNSIPVYANIRFMPLRAFSRISVGRLAAPLRVLQKIYQAKPDILIVNTHELLIVAVLNRIFFGTRIIYDIRENYFRNILFSEAFPTLLKPLVACWVRISEIVTAPAFRTFFLAEKGYEKEMSFFRGRTLIIENKASLPVTTRTSQPGEVRLLFSGTLAESTGIFEAVGLAKTLHQAEPSVRLRIVGYCAKPGTLQRLKTAIKGSDFITLTGGDQLVPHTRIVEEIAASDFGIVYYPPSRHTENSVPTKLYEYLAGRLPVLLQDKPAWKELCEPSRAALVVDFENIDPPALLRQMRSPFYTTPPTGVTWESEGEKLLNALRRI